MKRPLTRKERSARQRAARMELRRKQQESLSAGEGKYLPARDQGPIKVWVRDFVDTRRSVSEYMLPILLVILILSFLNTSWSPSLANALWLATILTVTFETWMLLRSVRRNVTEIWGAEYVKGTRFYALMRATQPRFLRMPKPGIPRGGEPRLDRRLPD